MKTEGNEQWVSVAERLPPDGTLILLYNSAMLCCVVGLCYNGKFTYHTAMFGTNKDYLQHKSDCMVTCVYPDKVTHWMPLPSPPDALITALNK